MLRCSIAALLVLCTSAAADDDLFGITSSERPLELPTFPSYTGMPDFQPQEDAAAVKAPPPPFGTKGTMFGTFGAGLAYNFDHATDYNLRAAWSYFVVKNVEFSVELNGWYFEQPGDNAFGINPAFVFRWHAFNWDRWSIYGDMGIGMVFSTQDVPSGGTDVNFTPRFGGGFTYRLDDEGTRLQVGLRWHHISNARITGDLENPARDSVMLHAGIMIPF